MAQTREEILAEARKKAEAKYNAEKKAKEEAKKRKVDLKRKIATWAIILLIGLFLGWVYTWGSEFVAFVLL